MEKVLKLSLEEKEHLLPEEEEALRKAMELSVLEESCNQDNTRKRPSG